MDLIMTGISASERMKRENLVSATRNLIMDKMQIGGSIRVPEVCILVQICLVSLLRSLINVAFNKTVARGA